MLWQLPGDERVRPVVLDLLVRSGVVALAAELLGGDDVRLLQEAFIVKRRGAGGRILPHQDYSYTGYLDAPRAIGVRFPLAPETVQSGCLWVVDGSHRWGLVGGVHALGDRLRDVHGFLSTAQAAQLDTHRVMLELAPGDVSFHHCLTLHGSDENRSETPRRTIVTHIVAGACRVVRERLPSAEAVRHFQTDAAGRLAGERFPVLRPYDTRLRHRPWARAARAPPRGRPIGPAARSAVAEEPHRLADFSESESAKCRHVGLVIDLAATDDTLVPGRRRQVRGLATEELGKAAEGRSIVVAKGAISNEPQARPPGRGPVPALDMLRPAIQHVPALIALVAHELAFGFGTREGQQGRCAWGLHASASDA